MEDKQTDICVACGKPTSKHHLKGNGYMCHCASRDYVLVYTIETDENILEVYDDGGEN